MSDSSVIHDIVSAAHESNDHSPDTNIAIVANTSAIAAAVFAPSGISGYHLIKLRGVPAAALIPKCVLGFSTDKIAKNSEIDGPGPDGSWDDHVHNLIGRTIAIAKPSTEHEQAENFRAFAETTAAFARERFDQPHINGDVGYITDFRSTYADEDPWGLRKRVSFATLKQRYGTIARAALEEAFSGVALSDQQLESLEKYIYNDARDLLSGAAVEVIIFGLNRINGVPAFESIYVDQFVADNLKVVRETFRPLAIESSDHVYTVSHPPRTNISVQARYWNNADTEFSANHFHARADQVVASGLNTIDRASLAAVMASVSNARNTHTYYGIDDPRVFDRATPAHIQKLAIVLAQSMSGPTAVIGDMNNIADALVLETQC